MESTLPSTWEIPSQLLPLEVSLLHHFKKPVSWAREACLKATILDLAITREHIVMTPSADLLRRTMSCSANSMGLRAETIPAKFRRRSMIQSLRRLVRRRWIEPTRLLSCMLLPRKISLAKELIAEDLALASSNSKVSCSKSNKRKPNVSRLRLKLTLLCRNDKS